mmetsp:Transcript_12559/g.48233  ORF Transcript_12559/g.48233 Transcript_12559/m.48233 type:complete len:289 (-) Transcript_12559:176-1042(-)
MTDPCEDCSPMRGNPLASDPCLSACQRWPSEPGTLALPLRARAATGAPPAAPGRHAAGAPAVACAWSPAGAKTEELERARMGLAAGEERATASPRPEPVRGEAGMLRPCSGKGGPRTDPALVGPLDRENSTALTDIMAEGEAIRLATEKRPEAMRTRRLERCFCFAARRLPFPGLDGPACARDPAAVEEERARLRVAPASAESDWGGESGLGRFSPPQQPRRLAPPLPSEPMSESDESSPEELCSWPGCTVDAVRTSVAPATTSFTSWSRAHAPPTLIQPSTQRSPPS